MLDALIKLASWTQNDSYKALEDALSVPVEKWSDSLLSNGVDNYVIVSTCNRLEIYYSSEDDLQDFPFSETARKYSGAETIDHLFRVTAGLDSMSVGENEILHQVKEAFERATRDKHAHDSLSLIFRKAISSGKLVRRDTEISRGKVSIPALSVDILQRHHGVTGKKIAVIGTGKMASDVIKYLEKLNPADITIVGRSREKADSLASSFGASSETISRLDSVISENDVLVTATSSKALVVKRDMMSGIMDKKVFLDISNPRNVEEPGVGDTYTLIDLKSLQPILEKNKQNKSREIDSAMEIVERQSELIKSKLSKLETENLIASLYKHADKLKRNEISRLKKALSAGANFDDALEAMSSALVKKLLAFQTDVLRNVHGSIVTDNIQEAVENADSEGRTNGVSKKPEDRRETQNQQDQTPRLSQKP